MILSLKYCDSWEGRVVNCLHELLVQSLKCNLDSDNVSTFASKKTCLQSSAKRMERLWNLCFLQIPTWIYACYFYFYVYMSVHIWHTCQTRGIWFSTFDHHSMIHIVLASVVLRVLSVSFALHFGSELGRWIRIPRVSPTEYPSLYDFPLLWWNIVPFLDLQL